MSSPSVEMGPISSFLGMFDAGKATYTSPKHLVGVELGLGGNTSKPNTQTVLALLFAGMQHGKTEE